MIKLAKGTASWIATPLFLSIIFMSMSIYTNIPLRNILLFLSIFSWLALFFFLIFFRDPDRKTGEDIVAPADGKIREITILTDRDIGRCIRISTFMNIHNVHVNRMPLDGVIKNIVHLKGSHVPAFRKDSDRNERVVITIDTGIGMLKICQIAGTLARRITPYIKKDDSIRKGTRIGIIKLGSRVDLYLPLSSRIKINIKEGDKVKAGEDTIAKIHG